MTAPEPPLPVPDRNALQREAATWFARMHGPAAEASRQDFETWLANSTQHLGAYNRAAEIWSLGKFLSDTPPSDATPAFQIAPSGQRRPKILTSSARLVIGLLLVGLLVLTKASNLSHDQHPEIANPERPSLQPSYELATQQDEDRTVWLPDGSSVTLKRDTRLVVSFDSSDRRLRLERGGARFEVAHEQRPFVVAAGSGTVRARGTIFDVALTPDRRVSVKLLRGSVDVAMPTVSQSPKRPARMLARLTPGDHVDFADARSFSRPDAPQLSGRFAIIDLQRVQLADLLATANRNARAQILLGDTTLAGLEISGSVRIDEPDRLAAQLSAVLNLKIDRQSPSRIVLQRR